MNKGGRRYTSLQREEQPPFFIFTMKIFSFIFLGFLTGPDMEIGGGFRPNSGKKRSTVATSIFFPPPLWPAVVVVVASMIGIVVSWLPVKCFFSMSLFSLSPRGERDSVCFIIDRFKT